MDHTLNLLELIRLILRWKKPILILCALATITAVIVSDPHIIKPKFKSTSVFFAASPNMTSSQTLFVDNNAEYFGSSDDIDRLLSIANSAPLKSYIVQKYKLFDVYKIDSANTEYPNYKVMKELEENYTAFRNDKGAVEITVFDTDKERAAIMCNEIVAKVDEMNNNIILENKRRILAIYNTKINEKQEQIKVLNDSIVSVKMMLQGSPSGPASLRNSGSENSSRTPELLDQQLKLLEDQKKAGLKELNNTIGLAEQYRSTINTNIPTVFILEKAYAAEKKSKPIRWIIVLGSLLAAMSGSIIMAWCIEKFRAIKQKLNNEQ
jgi:capsular polysaccharide biosynthesis protein